MRKNSRSQLIEFKGTTIPVVAVTLRSLNVEDLAHTATDLFGDSDFFDGDAALLELAQAGDADDADWGALRTVFARHGLSLIGVRGGSEALRAAAAAAGLPAFAAHERAQRSAADALPQTEISPAPAVAAPSEIGNKTGSETAPNTSSKTGSETGGEADSKAGSNASSAPAGTPAEIPAPSRAPVDAVPTLVVTRPLRSGQQVYARGGDLVVLAAVNPGAEVIADGSIHIYAPLRGRALAGARGQHGARIFTTHFAAELVSVGGVYRTFEGGVPATLAGKPVQVQLDEKGEAGGSTLTLDVMAID